MNQGGTGVCQAGNQRLRRSSCESLLERADEVTTLRLLESRLSQPSVRFKPRARCEPGDTRVPRSKSPSRSGEAAPLLLVPEPGLSAAASSSSLSSRYAS